MRSLKNTAIFFLALLPAVALGQTVSFWGDAAVPATLDCGNRRGAELGLKFSSDVAGSVTGVRFYKSPANTGVHVGNLWSTFGQKLATVTFTDETASGWQQAYFSAPVAIKANTTYVISYYAPAGHYSVSQNYFSSTGLDVPPLHAPSGSNGVLAYAKSSGFPNRTQKSSNYWVDVIFLPNASTAGPLATTTALSTSLNPSAAGQAITLTARVTATSGTPSGSVEFLDGSTVLSTTSLSSGGASLTTNVLSSGAHSLTARYSGNSSYNSSTSAVLVQTVNELATTTAVSSSLDPSSAGQAVTFAARVTSVSGTPSGIVQFADGSTVIGSGNLSSGAASMTTSSLSAATHSITARYGGDSMYSASASAPLLQTVNAATATATQTKLASSLNPSIIGQPVTFTVTVTAATGTPTGSVQVLDGTTVIGTGTLAGGTVSVTVSSLSAGTNSMIATYGGDSTYSGSSSSVLSQTVDPHTVLLSWVASTSTDVAGYNIYRAAGASGPYTKLNSVLVTGTGFTDSTVQSGQAYYYVCTAVDTAGTESAYSNAAEAVVPTP